MSTTRVVEATWSGRRTLEGAGVRLRRAFGHQEVPRFDPFLLLDDFHSDNPDDYRAGFPWHPHRGIETVTYVLQGRVRHKDSLGNSGVISSGDVQWMTAGSGIIHEEMPDQDIGRIWGFQLWANLPASHKMMQPRYRDVKAGEIAEVEVDGASVKVICGEVDGVVGPVRDIVTDPSYLDVSVLPNAGFTRSVPPDHKVFAYVIEGSGAFDEAGTEPVTAGGVLLWGAGGQIRVAAGEQGLRFLLVAGAPIGEPVAWYGPIVMNTDEELRTAFEDYRKGTFIKAG